MASDLWIQVDARLQPFEIELPATPTERALPGGNRAIPWQDLPDWLAERLARACLQDPDAAFCAPKSREIADRFSLHRLTVNRAP